MNHLQSLYRLSIGKVVPMLSLCVLLILSSINIAYASKTRSISLYMINTKQSVTVTYKVNGRYVPAAMKKINHVVRDWRANEAIKMSPKLIDLLWDLHRELGSKREIRVISGYRSPKTNAKLRKRSKGVAKRSNHMLGIAMDVQFPDVPLRTLREAGLLKRAGGVGYYPRSGIPFVHIDVGRVRHWPNMGAKAYAALMKRGKPYGGYKRTPSKTTTIKKAPKSTLAKNTKPQKMPIRLASVPKPLKRPELPTIAPQKPAKVPTLPTPKPSLDNNAKLRPTIADPDLFSEDIILAAIFEDEEDGDILTLDEYRYTDEVQTNTKVKQDLSFVPVRDIPPLAPEFAPLPISLTNEQANKMVVKTEVKLIGQFKNVEYPDLSLSGFK